MRWLLVAFLAAFVLASGAVAIGQTFAAPTWAQLFVGLDGRSPRDVPGLVRPIIPDPSRTPTTIPSARECARQWNQHAPAATRRWLGSHQATRADITAMTSGAQKIGTTKRYFISQCAFGIRVGLTALVAAVAPLPRTGAAWRGELLGYRTTTALTRLVRMFNATVTSAGMLQLR